MSARGVSSPDLSSPDLSARDKSVPGTGSPSIGARDVVARILSGLTAAGVLLSADVHLQLWTEGFRTIHLIGPLFLLNAAGGLVIGVAVVTWRHWLPLLAAVGFGAATLIAFWLSVTVGLLGLKEVATGTPQILAEVAEIVAFLCGLGALLLGRRSTVGPQS